ncbi:MAG TPA: CBS domain-containing protein [Tahibacter sp.]|nr:CBS domain-containing protein [Tahibacter sp.]
MRQVKHLLTDKGSQIYAIEPEEPVLQAIQTMADHHVGALLVMRGDELAGIVSERDYARKVILLGRSSAETPVWQIMSAPVQTVDPEQSVDDCMRLCTERRIRHLPVVEQGRVVGVLSIGDLVKAVIDEQAEELAQLQRYIAG